ncbi:MULTISPECIES: AAA family ATPase [unclassified Burkholderia]|uniref:AAA family ATPase n=1 Tax=unclassified Burkholderia TaxID=2613784 RepID=UPI0019825023|nr:MULTISPECIES: AAA family ATPase [unclassified Burkholderia]MBN3769264.1 AAA family ATPase [Burkholderia sp. Se-20378]MBN3793977.1 AAA family ATPase [Burkholderia sp. Ac-20392]
MQLFDRSTVEVPAVLQSSYARKAREELLYLFEMDEKVRAQTRTPRFANFLDDTSLQAALFDLFHGKCAFCESKLSGAPQVVPFRPSSDVSPMGDASIQHLYYGWLALAWQNLYPICSGCNKSDRHDFFPVYGKRVELPSLMTLRRYVKEDTGLWPEYPIKERPALLDPCGKRRPRLAIGLHENGELFSKKSLAAGNTIEKFDLNRSNLVRRRRRIIYGYVSRLLKLGPQVESISRMPYVFAFQDLEFGGLWHGLLCDAVEAIVGRTLQNERALDRNFWEFYRDHPRGASFRKQVLRKLIEWHHTSEPHPQSAGTKDIRDPGRLISIKLKNFKSVEALEVRLPTDQRRDRELTPALLILGENAVGKSTVLEAIALGLSPEALGKGMDGDLDRFRLNPAYLGGKRSSRHRTARLHFEFENGKRTVAIGESFAASAQSPVPLIFAYGAFRQFVENRQSNTALSPVATLFNQEAILPNPEEWLLGLDSDDFDMVIRALREIISVEGNFEIVERDHSARRCYVVSRIETGGGSKRLRTPLGTVSSGFRSVLAMTCDIFRGLMDRMPQKKSRGLDVATGIVLIDEVEAHLHPRWKMQIMRGLRSALPRMTFIVTSHDPLCLRGMEDDEVVVMRRAVQDRLNPGIMVKVELNDDLPKVSQLTVEQLLTADFFGLLSTDRPEVEQQMARVADLLAKRRNGELSEQEAEVVKNFEGEIAESLPVGSSEAQRLVQEAVAEFLKERRNKSAEQAANLRKAAKDRILDILRGV